MAAHWELERRTWTVAGLELRSTPNATTIAGYAALYNNLSDDLGGFRERILPGAFAEALSPAADVRALWQHDPSHVLGRTINGTLRLASDEHGLRFEVDPPGTSWAQDALVSLRRGDVTQMSFGFYVPEGGDTTQREGEMLVRTLLRVQLVEVSPVTFPAYPATNVDVRSLLARLRAQEGGQTIVDDQAQRVRAQAAARERMLQLVSQH